VTDSFIPFNKPCIVGTESGLMEQALQDAYLHGNGRFTKECHTLLEGRIGCLKALLTPSCTAALEMCAILADIHPGDEIIMPSYTFVTTANAFVLRGGVPVFIDIRPDTLNIDEAKIEAAITPRTKAIMCVHYAGVSCHMQPILALAKKHNLLVIEDAAQGVEAFYQSKPLGGIGHLGAMSFHATKNIISGEGGALFVNDQAFIDRAEIVWEKGTNRKTFLLGQVDKYSWVDIGSSYLPSEVTAAFLLAQLRSAKDITKKRLEIWDQYHKAFEPLEVQGHLRRPIVPTDCQHNAHMYYILLQTHEGRNNLMAGLKEKGIQTVTHYVPLHDSVGGVRFGRTHGDLVVTEDLPSRLLRLPLYPDLSDRDIARVTQAVSELS